MGQRRARSRSGIGNPSFKRWRDLIGGEGGNDGGGGGIGFVFPHPDGD